MVSPITTAQPLAAGTISERPEFFTFPNGAPAPAAFGAEEYAARVAGLRAIMAARSLDAVIPGSGRLPSAT